MQSWADCITGTHESSFWKRQVKTRQYPTENEAREKFQLTVNRWLEIIADKKKEAAN
jgi:hypothetical protein